jgi:myo-inositol-1(or 4)-monophosphatase
VTADFTNDHVLVAQAVREAGDIARRYYNGNVESWEKKPGDPVSEADLAIDSFLKERLMAARPDYGWLSEETADDPSRLDKNRVWVVDPIDGTRSFIAKKPEFTVCAALVENGLPILGIVYNPILEEFYEAEVGKGAFLNQGPITCGSRSDLDGATLLTSRKTFEWHGWIDNVPDATFSHVNSIAYRMVKVASRHVDASLSFAAKSDWDIAAADIILSEAGGMSTTTSGEPHLYNREKVVHRNVISCGKSLHPLLMEMLSSFGNEKKT